MLDVVAQLNLSPTSVVTIPKQVFIHDSASLFDSSNDFNFPLIAKPLVADGTADSHNMALVFNKNGLKNLHPPLVLQDFVNHGGVIFKVYVVGNYVQCVKRSSLSDITDKDRSYITEIDYYIMLKGVSTQKLL